VTIVTVSKINRDNLCKKIIRWNILVIAAIIIGLSLGLIGGGGSILAVPILVYLFKINPEQATSYSLIVGFTAMIGSFSHHKLGNLKIKSALVLLFPLFYLCTGKIMLPLLPDSLFSVSFDVTKFINHDRVCLSNDCNLRFHDSQIKENQRSKKLTFNTALIGLLVGLM
jgi:hypothetical protein